MPAQQATQQRACSGDSPALNSQGLYVVGGAFSGCVVACPFSAPLTADPNSSTPGMAARKSATRASLPGYQATRRGSRARRSLPARAQRAQRALSGQCVLCVACRRSCCAGLSHAQLQEPTTPCWTQIPCYPPLKSPFDLGEAVGGTHARQKQASLVRQAGCPKACLNDEERARIAPRLHAACHPAGPGPRGGLMRLGHWAHAGAFFSAILQSSPPPISFHLPSILSPCHLISHLLSKGIGELGSA